MEDLKDCPFCGEAGQIEQIESACFGIGCEACDFQIMSGTEGIGWFSTKNAAAVAWNRRAHVPEMATK